MAVDIGTVRRRLKDLFETVEGIQTSFAYTPSGITDAHCPCVLIYPAEADLDFAFNTGQLSDRLWRFILIVAKEGSASYGDLEQAFDEFPERIENLFAANLKLNDLDAELVSAVLAEDSGMARIEFPPLSDQWWLGCEWNAVITIKRSVTVGT